MMNIAINEVGGGNWTGGITYRKNLIEALRYVPDIKIFLVRSPQGHKLEDPSIEVIPHPTPTNKISKIIYKASRYYLKQDLELKTKLKGKVDVIFPSSLKYGNIPSIYWIPDFQFVHLPHMFTATQLRNYNTNLVKHFERVPLIVVSSHDAQNDFKNFAPKYVHKTRVMQFVAHIPAHLYDANPLNVVRTYNLPESFIYMPNQFWAHKNHIKVFEALRILKEKNIKPFIVFTGNPTDRRNPQFLADLLEKISMWGLRDQVAFLGLIPHHFVYSLIRQSKFVLNPSFFEGWSTTVEESKSVGKRMLLSNLNVHQEQAPAMSMYFDPNSAEELSEKLRIMWSNTPSGPDIELEHIAKNKQPERMKKFGETFFSIAKEALG